MQWCDDDNCNQSVDENAVDQTIYFIDNDGDGVGGTTFQLACSAPQGYVDIPGDCDDTNGSVNQTFLKCAMAWMTIAMAVWMKTYPDQRLVFGCRRRFFWYQWHRCL